jgi:hypothetical protein
MLFFVLLQTATLQVADTDTVTRELGLEPVWSLNGTWTGVAGNETSGELYAANGKSIALFDAAGNTVREFSAFAPILRRARINASGDVALLAFSMWSPQVTAYGATGQKLWAYPRTRETSVGLEDVWAVDLNGDNVDEIVIGFGGFTGVHVIDVQGNLLWQSSAIGNVWRVTGGRVGADGSVSVVTTSARGQVHVFTADGKSRTDLDPRFYAVMVRVVRAKVSVASDTILAAGTPLGAANTVAVAALSGTGSIKWSVQLPSNIRGYLVSTTVSETRPWVALSLRGGQVYVLETGTGGVIAHIDGQGEWPQVEWMSDERGSPTLVISSGSTLSAFKVAGGARAINPR